MSINDVLRHGVRVQPDDAGITPGGVLAYGDAGRHIATVPFGQSHFRDRPVPAPDASTDARTNTIWPNPFAVTADTIYDIASLTKPIATTASFMKLDIDPDAPAVTLLPELRGLGPVAERVTFAHLLGHASGWPAHIKFYEQILAGQRAGAPDARSALYALVLATPLVAEPGTIERYSDLGYIALGLAIERATGKRLDQAVEEMVLAPLGLTETRYADLLGDPASRPDSHPDSHLDSGGLSLERTAPTEVCPYRGLVHGQVHDDNAHAGGGIFGHAGLFSTAADVAAFARAALSWLDGQPVGGFQPDLARRLATDTAAPGAVHTLGWDRPSPAPASTHTGTLWPRSSVGHLGFTGCALWLDPPRGRYVVLLTNRVHPSRDVLGIKEFRGAVMDAVVRELGASA